MFQLCSWCSDALKRLQLKDNFHLLENKKSNWQPGTAFLFPFLCFWWDLFIQKTEITRAKEGKLSVFSLWHCYYLRQMFNYHRGIICKCFLVMTFRCFVTKFSQTLNNKRRKVLFLLDLYSGDMVVICTL